MNSVAAPINGISRRSLMLITPDTIPASSTPFAHVMPDPSANVSRINKRQCTRCTHWFWAWSDVTRQLCYQCDPPSREYAQARIAEGL